MPDIVAAKRRKNCGAGKKEKKLLYLYRYKVCATFIITTLNGQMGEREMLEKARLVTITLQSASYIYSIQYIYVINNSTKQNGLLFQTAIHSIRTAIYHYMAGGASHGASKEREREASKTIIPSCTIGFV